MNLWRYLLARLPIPTGTRLRWQRDLLLRMRDKEIATARKAKDLNRVEELRRDYDNELSVHEEEQAIYLTRNLIGKARRLHVPTPRWHNDDRTESEFWYTGHHMYEKCLTSEGVSKVREEIRREINARHESLSHWLKWIAPLTGIMGTIIGLVAVYFHR